MEPQLDEELAWDTGWTCPSCTLVNEMESSRCAACGSLRSSLPTFGVVVVVPPERKQKREADSQWACPACTLLNDEGEDRCRACGGQRWLTKKPKTAAALRAARRDLSKSGSLGLKASSLAEEHGIWGGLGPDREFLPLPPAPEGRSVHRSAKDTDVDIFAELLEEASEKPKSEEKETSKEPEPQKREEEASKKEEEEEEKEDPFLGPSKSSEQVLPAWRVQGAPLFTGDPAPESLPLGLSEADAFEDAVGRLALSGFEVTKCHLALEAAGGDENLARQFLLCPE